MSYNIVSNMRVRHVSCERHLARATGTGTGTNSFVLRLTPLICLTDYRPTTDELNTDQSVLYGGGGNEPHRGDYRKDAHMERNNIMSPKLPQCLFTVSYVIGIDTEVKRHHSQ